MAWLPQWFVIDKPQTTTPATWLPAGFVVDQPQQQMWWFEKWLRAVNKFVGADTGWSSFQQFIAAPVWLLSWMGKVAEKTTWAAMDWAGKKLFWESYGTAWGSVNKVVPKVLWWAEQWWAYKIWENVGKQLPAMAATAGIWSVSGWLWARLAKWAIWWTVNTQASSLLTEWKLASATDTLIWAWIWATFGWITWGQANKTKKILNIIKESDTKWNKSAALARQGIDESQSSLSKRWNGSKNVVLPSKKSKDAADTIVQNIRWASSKPQKLYTQVSGKIKEIATDLSPKLQQVKVGTMTKTNTAVKNAITDLAVEWEWNLSKNWVKKINDVAISFSKAKNLDEVWNTAKQLDDQIPETIKKGINLSAREQGIRDAWRAARGIINDHIDETASNIADVTVKDKFKVMSNLFHAKWQISDNIAKLTPKVTWAKTKLIRAAKWLAGTATAGKVLQKMWVFWW